MSYNGWANYETWLANMYFLDDPEVLLEGAEFTSTYELGQYIKDRVEDYVFEVYGSQKLHGFASDLLRAAFSSINWYELAQHLINDLDADQLSEYGYQQ